MIAPDRIRLNGPLRRGPRKGPSLFVLKRRANGALGALAENDVGLDPAGAIASFRLDGWKLEVDQGGQVSMHHEAPGNRESSSRVITDLQVRDTEHFDAAKFEEATASGAEAYVQRELAVF